MEIALPSPILGRRKEENREKKEKGKNQRKRESRKDIGGCKRRDTDWKCFAKRKLTKPGLAAIGT